VSFRTLKLGSIFELILHKKINGKKLLHLNIEDSLFYTKHWS